MKKATISVLMTLFLVTSNAIAQSEGSDFMREIGKMYVVVAVIVAIFLGIIFYLIILDRKLTKLENQIKEDDV